MIEAAELVVDHDDDGQAERDGEVGQGVLSGERHLPATGAFDQDVGVLRGEGVEAVAACLDIDAAVFQQGGGIGGGGHLQEHRVDLLDGENATAGLLEGERIASVAAGEGLVADGVMTGPAQRLDEQAGDVGLARVGVGAGDEVVHEGGGGRGEPRRV